ncbi:LysE family translocator [Alteromonas sp. ASW11-36]|uniref:LysE family translocator n=1 Tax=Alteromonas arenosi TaxID=3055817 RepID=A0ABT7SXD1_9ALTE|nr:LysE family translocator [Alteromonas sp. ASW11-36]MDM7860820.1 LysE family translocator [Alteromonas sp. ASW11-36]
MSEVFASYWVEFLTIAAVHFVAVISPGPDFAIVVKNSVRYGRTIAYATSIGIGVGILLHVAYSLLGISLLIKTTPWLYTLFSYVAGAYLLFLAWGAIRAQPPQDGHGEGITAVNQGGKASISWIRAFWIGFLTNGLNPKATLFFMSVFTAVISIETPLSVQIGYGIYLAFATGLWFCTLSYLLGTSRVVAFVGDKGYILDRMMGVMLVLLALNLIVLHPL